MQTYKLIANVIAALLTFASISAINYNITRQPAQAAVRTAHVTNLPPVYVYPSASELGETSMQTAIDTARIVIAATPRTNRGNASHTFKSVESKATVQ